MKNVVDTDRKVSNNKTPEIVRTNIAIDLAINDMTTGQCAKKYGIAQQTICRWLRNDKEFVNDVERYRQNAVDEKIDALNRVILSNIDQQIQNIINISMDSNAPYSTRLDASKFLINKFIPDKGKQTIHTQNNTQINVDNTNNTNNKQTIEDILKSLDDNIIDPTNKDDDF